MFIFGYMCIVFQLTATRPPPLKDYFCLVMVLIYGMEDSDSFATLFASPDIPKRNISLTVRALSMAGPTLKLLRPFICKSALARSEMLRLIYGYGRHARHVILSWAVHWLPGARRVHINIVLNVQLQVYK